MPALLAVWIALGALITTVIMVASQLPGREAMMMILPYTYALSVTLAAADLWRVRSSRADEPGVSGRRLQAGAAVAINTLALAILLIWANGLLNGLAGLGIEIGFIAICYWGYKRVVLRE